MPEKTAPLIVAHRGYSSRHRENSPHAWHAAVEAGADVVETDIRMTRDGTLVCCHDADLLRVAGRPDVIAESDADELARIVVAGAHAAPTLALLFSILPHDQPILFDVKDEEPAVLDRLVAAAKASQRRSLIFGLHRFRSVAHVRAQTEAAILGLLGEDEDVAAFFSAGGTILRLWEGDAAPERIAAHVERGRPVWVTTGHRGTSRAVGDFAPEALRAMAGAGANGFLVNDPVAARTALAASQPEVAA